jgi:OFA family oxalate/formate antiporter-like MFS transporter
LPSLLSRAGVFYGWWVVFAAAAIVFLSAGTFFYGFGLLVEPLTDEFGWSRASIAAAFSLRTEVGGIAAPAIGFAVDRVGVRRLTAIGVCVVAVGFALMSRVDSLWAFYATTVLVALGMSATGGATAATVISHWFRRNRGKALGLMTLGGGTSGLTAVIFAQLISDYGWRTALVIVGVGQLIFSLPLALSLRNRPEDVGLTPDGLPVESRPPAPGSSSSALAMEPAAEFTTRQALRSPLFWKVALVFALSNFATTGLIVHQVPFLTESAGVSDGFAAASITLMTGISIPGRLLFGGAADRYPRTMVVAIALACTGTGLMLLATVSEPWQIAYSLPLFSIGFGAAVPLRSVLQAEYFGLKAFGAIQGMILTVTTLFAFIGPVLAGLLYDHSASYRLAFVILACGPLLAIPLVLSLKPGERLAPSVSRAA